MKKVHTCENCTFWVRDYLPENHIKIQPTGKCTYQIRVALPYSVYKALIIPLHMKWTLEHEGEGCETFIQQ